MFIINYNILFLLIYNHMLHVRDHLFIICVLDKADGAAASYS